MKDVIIEKLSKEELESRGVFSWSIWTKEISTFPWTYDSNESCYFLEGEVTLTSGDKKYIFGKGDFVTFPEGMDCEWDITKSVKKHYTFF